MSDNLSTKQIEHSNFVQQNTVFSGYVKRIYDKYSYYNNINDYIQKIDTGNIDSIDNIIKALYEIEDISCFFLQNC